jgi:hypothetical protein
MMILDKIVYFFLFCRETLSNNDEDDNPEGDLASMPSLHDICIISDTDSDSEEDSDPREDDAVPPPSRPPSDGLSFLR